MDELYAASLQGAAILGLVEGLTEFIPVSSTAHLILVGNLIGFQGEVASSFEIFIQLGAILAVLTLYWRRFLDLLRWNEGNGLAGKRGMMNIAIAIFPALIAGAVFHSQIKEKLFSPIPVAFALIAGGIVLLFIERKLGPRRIQSPEDITARQSFIVGVLQVLSLWPGVSRSGSTIVGGLLAGCDRKTAAEFSFIIAVPVMLAATVYDLKKSWHILQPSDLPMFAVGFVVSYFVALLALKFFIRLLGKTTLVPFGYYRIAVGLLVLVAQF